MLGILLTLLISNSPGATGAETRPLEIIEVRSPRETASSVAETSLTVLDSAEIARERPVHPNEIFDRVPGAWIVRASGQEHLTALRSPVFTGPGACGAFLVLENKVPTRPAGFCNVNELFEVNIPQASRIEVLRGPGTVVQGGNALHGAILVDSTSPPADGRLSLSLEAGANDYRRGSLATSGDELSLAASYTDAGSFRIDEGYRQAFANLGWRTTAGKANVHTSFSWAYLDQDTAGFIIGKDAYRDSELRSQNLNPDAFRNVRAARLVSNVTWKSARRGVLELIPYLRSSEMEFLQHFLPGAPLERNGQDSAGVLFSWSGPRNWSVGADIEWADGYLAEFQPGPVVSGSAFLRETRPSGFHYDYDVTAISLAAWSQKSINISNNHILTIGIRFEHNDYEYRNGMLDGNTRDDGTECGFGGCLYTRPESRADRFRNFAPELGLRWNISDTRKAHIRLTQGFRAPQATELYRLQSGQSVADLDTVTLAALEAGFSARGDQWRYEIAAYLMRKDDFIFRDSAGFNVSDGKSRHSGVEFDLFRQLTAHTGIDANFSWSNHEYDFSRTIARGEMIRSGNQIDTAPEWLGALRLNWAPREHQVFEAEWVYTGSYYLDAANQHEYGGHSLLNLRAAFELPGGGHHLSLRLNNLLDNAYAERADFAFGDYRYFPGGGRQLFVTWEYRR
jgi:outer membrane receptor protein involved in Fe transport